MSCTRLFTQSVALPFILWFAVPPRAAVAQPTYTFTNVSCAGNTADGTRLNDADQIVGVDSGGAFLLSGSSCTTINNPKQTSTTPLVYRFNKT
jgi:hypothetical protein